MKYQLTLMQELAKKGRHLDVLKVATNEKIQLGSDYSKEAETERAWCSTWHLQC